MTTAQLTRRSLIADAYRSFETRHFLTAYEVLRVTIVRPDTGRVIRSFDVDPNGTAREN